MSRFVSACQKCGRDCEEDGFFCAACIAVVERKWKQNTRRHKDPGYVCAQCGKPCEIEIVGYWPRPHSCCCHMPARPAEERLPLDVIAIRDRGGTHAHDAIPPQESIAESPPGQDGSSMSANYRRGLADGADEEAPSRDSDEDYLRGYIAGRMDPARALAALMVNPPPVPAQMDHRSAPPVPAPPPPAPDPRGHAGRPSPRLSMHPRTTPLRMTADSPLHDHSRTAGGGADMKSEEHIDKIIKACSGDLPALLSPGFREEAIRMTEEAGALPRVAELEMAAIWYAKGRASVASSEEIDLIVQALRRMESQLLPGTRAATVDKLADRLQESGS